ncbi:MAG: chloride channel protein [Deltaproteobacteria bacterium]|nr:chloride channel protein [Deltaproteobacteria bacterium]
MHTALVGLAGGLVGAAFFAAVERTQQLLLERVSGYQPLRAAGERFQDDLPSIGFHPILLVVVLTLGGLAVGLMTRWAPEIASGGTDTFIEAVHARAGVIRRRVAAAKFLASMITLGTGGSGGREGPSMLIGGALGSFVSSVLKLSPRERRLLVIAGAAAGVSAVFRTPLGAALLAVEVLYRDGFESDALVPSILASVISYSVVISIFGESTLFTHATRYPFVPAHLPLYGLLALLTALVALAFESSIRRTRALFERVKPPWIRPAIGGLALGLFCVPIVVLVGHRTGTPGQGLGLLGSGYGAVQLAINGSGLFGRGGAAVELLILLTVGKLVASSLTLGSGGSAGDFAPSMVIGGLFGGAFGHAATLVLHDPRLDPSSFVLVGMGAFYGGIAHVPLSAMVLVCELAGSYDLLVPLMLAEAVAFVLLRKRTLYAGQLTGSNVAGSSSINPLVGLLVSDVLSSADRPIAFSPNAKLGEMFDVLQTPEGRTQVVFPVVDASSKIVGIVAGSTVVTVRGDEELSRWILAADLMQKPITASASTTLVDAARLMITHDLDAIPVVGESDEIIGLLSHADVTRAYLESARGASGPARPASIV